MNQALLRLPKFTPDRIFVDAKMTTFMFLIFPDTQPLSIYEDECEEPCTPIIDRFVEPIKVQTDRPIPESSDFLSEISI